MRIVVLFLHSISYVHTGLLVNHSICTYFIVLDKTLNNNVYLSAIELVLIVQFVLALLLVAVVVTKLPKCPLPLTKQPLHRALCCPTETEVMFW